MTEQGGGRPGGHSGGHSGGHPGGGHPGGTPRGGSDFERAYQGAPPWDIGRPQPVFVELAEAGRFGPKVLDVGCGTGEHSLYLASRGHDVTGVDGAASAIERATHKAEERGIAAARFIASDFFDAAEKVLLDGPFDSVIDCGFFHALSDERWVEFAHDLAALLRPGGLYAMLVFSDRIPGAWGPRRVSEGDVRATFAGPTWRVLEVRPAPLHTAIEDVSVLDGNLALIERA